MIKMYSKQDCPSCVKAAQELMLRGVTYVEIKLLDQEEIQKFKAEYKSARSVPYFVHNETPIGSFAALKNWLKENQCLD